MQRAAPFIRFDHIQLAMPANGEHRARKFYTEVLGMTEIEKPPNIVSRGGAWFRSGDLELHLGVDAEFTPARKAHPAMRCRDYDALIERVRSASVDVRLDVPLADGSRHAYIDDPFGNRIELIETAKEK